MTRVQFEYKDGTRSDSIVLNYNEWQQMFRSGAWEGKPIAVVEIEEKHSDKGPNRIRFS